MPPEHADIVGLAAPAAYVLIIENYTSFVRHVREVNQDRAGLVIYSGGFPARGHLRQIVRLAGLTSSPVYHWGDLDAGGVRIFRHLEEALSQSGVRLRPHLMDTEILCSHGSASNNQRRLAAGAAEQSAVAELWNFISETGLVLEQESVAPRRPIIA